MMTRVIGDGSSLREGEDGGGGSNFAGADSSLVADGGQDAEGVGGGRRGASARAGEGVGR
jgi:hypothetical protein